MSGKLSKDLLQSTQDWFVETYEKKYPGYRAKFDDLENPPKLSVDDVWSYFRRKIAPEDTISYPSFEELNAFLENIVGTGDDLEVTWKMFTEFLESRCKKSTPREELINAFRIFDPEENGYLELEDFVTILKNPNCGEPYEEGELKEFVHDSNMKGNGALYYEQFTNAMFAMAPNLKNIYFDDFLFDNVNVDNAKHGGNDENNNKHEAENENDDNNIIDNDDYDNTDFN